MGTKTHFWLFTLLLVFCIFLVVWKGLLVLAILFLIFCIYLLSFRLELGWYVLVFLAPMIHWEFRFSDYWYFFESYPRLLQVHAPLVEFWTVLLFCAYLVFLLRSWWQGVSIDIRLPGFLWFCLFIGSAALSFIHVPRLEMSFSVWYLFRFIVFFYIGYLVLGTNIIKDKQILHRSFFAFAMAGVLGMAMGIVSLFIGAWKAAYIVPRVTPFAIGSFAPFGDQHIFLAEVLTTTLPIMVYGWYIQKERTRKQLFGVLSVLMFFTILATLSRAGWITLFVEAVVFALLLTKQKFITHILSYTKKYALWLFVCVVPIALYFGYFLFTSAIVRSSNAARWTLAEVSWFLFTEHPITGHGVGTFIARLSEIEYFGYFFGDPVDAHGIIQKLLPEQGIVGAITFGLFLFWILYRIYERIVHAAYTKEARLLAWVGFFLVLSPLVFQLFNTQYYSSRMWVPIALALAQSIVFKSHKVPWRFQINLKPRVKIEQEV